MNARLDLLASARESRVSFAEALQCCMKYVAPAPAAASGACDYVAAGLTRRERFVRYLRCALELAASVRR